MKHFFKEGVIVLNVLFVFQLGNVECSVSIIL